MRLYLLLLLLGIIGLTLGLPHPQDVAEAEEDSEDAAEEDEEYDVYDALEDAAEDENGFKFGLGILEPNAEDELDEESVGYFASVENDELVGAQRADSYSSVKEGLVSSVKNQGKCGSCAAFSAIAAFEICYAKINKDFIDFSEQQLVDCGYKHAGAKGCVGAPQHSYMDWLADKKPGLTTEKDYPYKGTKTKYKCPKTLPAANTHARVAKAFYTYNGTEELMRRLVFLHGAVLATVTASGPLSQYKSGIFEGCEPGKKVDHAVTVVGYGREKGTDFWLIKNSWGTKWGEKGYFRLKRNVGMCSIGKSFSALECEAVSNCATGEDNCEDEDGSKTSNHEEEKEEQES